MLVNLAGKTSNGLWLKPMHEYSLNELMSIINVDLLGTFLMCKYVVPFMIKQKSGVIINMSGNSAIEGAEFGFGWVVAKSAVIGITKSLAKELGKYNIRVNAVAPGYVDTKWVRESSSEEELRWAANASSLKRLGKPHEVANLMLFLASVSYTHLTLPTTERV